MIANILIYVIAFFITLPILATWGVYFIAEKVTNHKLKAFHLSVHWTMICYMIAVFILSTIYFERIFGGTIGIILLIVLSIVIIFQWKTKTEIHFGKAMIFLWRFCFLMFGFIYICFIFYGIGLNIIQ